MGIYLKKKKIGACVFWAPYFFSHSAGNLPHLQKCYGINEENIDACVLQAPYFSKFFGGKIFYHKQPLTWIEPRKNNEITTFQSSVLAFATSVCTWSWINLVFYMNHSLSYSIRAWSIRDIDQSVCKKLK